MEAVVRWSPKGRALLALSVPVFAWLSWYSFTSVTQPSPAAGYVSIGATVAALLFQLHLATYRLEAGPRGITETFLWGQRVVAWDDVLKVEAIAQAAGSGQIYRWSAAPEAAFHIVVHSRKGRVSVHRWMTGVDDLIEALRVGRGASPYREGEMRPIDRDDPSVKPALRASPINKVVNQVHDGLLLFKAVVLVLPLSWVGGVIVAISTGFRVSGNPFVDGTLVALAPWGLGFAVYKLVERARKNRFGPEHARPPLSARDAILTMAAAMGGPVLLYGFVPRATSSREMVDVILCLAGLFLCWMPIAEVRKCLREA
jgi:hypothetical protein